VVAPALTCPKCESGALVACETVEGVEWGRPMPIIFRR